MSTSTREIVTQSAHDQVVNLVAQRWARSWQCQITINSDEERAKWAESDRSYADIYRLLVRSGLRLEPALEKMACLQDPPVDEMIAFVRGSKRGFAHAHRGEGDEA